MGSESVRMTLEELCKAVAEEMGWKFVDSPGGPWWKKKDDMNVPCPPPNTGNGMLDVIKDLKKRYETIQVEWCGWGAMVHIFDGHYEGKSGEGYAVSVDSGHAEPPIAVLLAFMKAVKGVEVELSPDPKPVTKTDQNQYVPRETP